MRIPLIMLLLFAAVGLAACDTGPKSARGFRLPDGDVTKGRETFVDLWCYECHEVPGVELPDRGEDPEITVVLGGEVRRIQTYGELVTSVINPSHKLAKGYPKEEISEDGKSKMRNFNDVMTITELTNLVAFLQAHYEIAVDDTLFYPYAP